MAQLVARFHGMEEVRGSNPLSSTSVVSRDIVPMSRDIFLFFALGCLGSSFLFWLVDHVGVEGMLGKTYRRLISNLQALCKPYHSIKTACDAVRWRCGQHMYKR